MLISEALELISKAPVTEENYIELMHAMGHDVTLFNALHYELDRDPDGAIFHALGEMSEIGAKMSKRMEALGVDQDIIGIWSLEHAIGHVAGLVAWKALRMYDIIGAALLIGGMKSFRERFHELQDRLGPTCFYPETLLAFLDEQVTKYSCKHRVWMSMDDGAQPSYYHEERVTTPAIDMKIAARALATLGDPRVQEILKREAE